MSSQKASQHQAAAYRYRLLWKASVLINLNFSMNNILLWKILKSTWNRRFAKKRYVLFPAWWHFLQEFSELFWCESLLACGHALITQVFWAVIPADRLVSWRVWRFMNCSYPPHPEGFINNPCVLPVLILSAFFWGGGNDCSFQRNPNSCWSYLAFSRCRHFSSSFCGHVQPCVRTSGFWYTADITRFWTAANLRKVFKMQRT